MDFEFWRLTHPLPQVVLTVSNSDFSTFEARPSMTKVFESCTLISLAAEKNQLKESTHLTI